MEKHRDLFGVKMRPEEAKAHVAKLREMMLDRVHRKLLGGRFHRQLEAGTLPLEAIRVFWQNWYSFVAEINNFLGCAYQRHLPFFKRHPELQAPFANQVADELIHPKPPGHIQIVLEQGRLFGLSDEEMIDYEMLPECRAFTEYYRGLLYEGTMAEWWAAFCLEEGVGHWARFFGQALRKGYKFQDKDIVYFTVHSEADLEVHAEGVLGHGDFDWMVLQKILEEGRADTRPGFSLEYALRTGCDYFVWFFEGVYQYVKKEGPYAA